MRALRILLIVVVVLGVLFVIVDRVAVHFAQSEAADKLKTTEDLASTPDVSIKGFPFLTQVASGTLDDVHVGIKDYDATTGTTGRTIRIEDLNADMKDVTFTGDYSSATAQTATGTALISYAELLKNAQTAPTDLGLGFTGQVVGLSDGGNGKIKVAVDVTVPGVSAHQKVNVLSTVTVKNNTVQVHADNLPKLAGVSLAEDRFRQASDFQQAINQLPGGIKLDKVQAEKDGVEIAVKGSNVKLAG
ncbi:LmeA family phospholipid-binding protein [Streptomyces sp. NPDC002172]